MSRLPQTTSQKVLPGSFPPVGLGASFPAFPPLSPYTPLHLLVMF